CPYAYSWELICRKNGAIACLVYTLRFRKALAFRRVTEEGYQSLVCLYFHFSSTSATGSHYQYHHRNEP
ncbi:MAG: hypothetical protein J7540_05085, partial [Roseofilum sp. SID2]|uniref:hypothetical protein n=1 Tax=Roseofilum sp. SID2 TaxID=2821498 RepID=UPI001B0293E0